MQPALEMTKCFFSKLPWSRSGTGMYHSSPESVTITKTMHLDTYFRATLLRLSDLSDHGHEPLMYKRLHRVHS